ncbi:MAG: heterodisulfide reductase-related iron-sulfur binding cluster [Gaiellaceae bacterium]
MAEPDVVEIRNLADECVHCGFCLPTCPTYVLWGEEMDSPRGRIHLLKELLEAPELAETSGSSPEQALTASVANHFDRCLGCMACLTSCPSGVKYDRLIEDARARVEDAGHRAIGERVVRELVFRTVPHPRRLRLALLAERIGRRLPLPRVARPLVSLAPPWRAGQAVPARTAARGESRGSVGLLVGCVQRVVFGDVNAATARVLSAEGFDVVAPRQGCCGALSVHAGRLGEGRMRARKLIDAFAGYEAGPIIVNAAGCGSTMKEYGHLLREDPDYAAKAQSFSERVRDVSEHLAATPPRSELHPLPLRIALQDSCHLLHAQRVAGELRSALGRVPALEIVEPREQELCCGSAGIYNLVQPEAAAELGRRKAARVIETHAEAYASANPGCLIQVSAGLRAEGLTLPALHPVEVLDASMRGLSVAEFVARSRS